MRHHTLDVPDRPEQGSARRIWRLQYGPCWCHGLPGETGSFDFVRTTICEAGLGNLDFNVLILSDRVIDGSQPVFLQVHQRVPSPRLVVATASCPAAAAFWDELPMGWSPVRDLVPIDLDIEECVSGHPEALMAAVLNHALSPKNANHSDREMSISTPQQATRDAVAH